MKQMTAKSLEKQSKPDNFLSNRNTATMATLILTPVWPFALSNLLQFFYLISVFVFPVSFSSASCSTYRIRGTRNFEVSVFAILVQVSCLLQL